MIGGRRGETIVTEEKSLEMSRPKEAAPRATPQQPRQQQGRPNQQASTPQQAAQPAQPATGAARPVVSQDQGEWVEVKNADGTTRKVRVVAPQGGPATAKPTGQ
jgi:cytoskeletal protein RodZ